MRFGQFACARKSVSGIRDVFLSVLTEYPLIAEVSVAKYLGVPFKKGGEVDWARMTERRRKYDNQRKAKIFCIPAAEKAGKLAKTLLAHPSKWITSGELKIATRMATPGSAIHILKRRYDFKIEKSPTCVKRSSSSVEILRYRLIPDDKKVFVVWI